MWYGLHQQLAEGPSIYIYTVFMPSCLQTHCMYSDIWCSYGRYRDGLLALVLCVFFSCCLWSIVLCHFNLQVLSTLFLKHTMTPLSLFLIRGWRCEVLQYGCSCDAVLWIIIYPLSFQFGHLVGNPSPLFQFGHQGRRETLNSF